MKKILLTCHSVICLVISAELVQAQYSLTIRLKTVPAQHRKEQIFVAGSFNNWQPSASGLSLNSKEEIWSATISDLKPGIYDFKLTRGSWSSVQVSALGKDVENKSIRLTGDTTINLEVAAWKDDFPEAPKQHTASANVSIMDSAFILPQLNTTRRIWVYLPEGYKNGKKRYPVIYMHDGQNLFDDYFAPNGEWGVDECLDSMIRNGAPACIVIGIDNAVNRMTEYNPFDNQQFGKSQGNDYLAAIVSSLKPYIDKRYRTLPAPQNTTMAGSSMGGLISYYAALKYPDVFGKAGIFSPAFWTASPAIYNYTGFLTKKLNARFFFYAGGSESDSMIPDMLRITDTLATRTSSTIYSFTDPESHHNEQAWRKWFPDFYKWITATGNNVIMKTKEPE